MKILHVVPSFGLGGMERVLCSIINGISEDVFHEILALNNENEARKWIENDSVKILSFTKPSTRFKFFQSVYQVIKSSNPSIVMTYNWGATDAIWLGRLARVSTIFHSEHGFNVDEAQGTKWKRDAIRFVVYRLTSQVIVVSQALYLSLKNDFLLPDRQLSFIPNGIDTTLFSPDLAERRRVRRELGLGEEHHVIGYSGRLDPVKNLEFLLQIFECAVQKNPFLRLMLVGDGPEKEKIEFMCRKKNLEDYVLFVGQTGNVLPYLRAFDVFLLTSFKEQMPMSILEAMSVEVPILASRVGGIPHMVTDGETGFLCELSDPLEDWVLRLLTILEVTCQRRMGAAARKIIVDKFKAKTMIDRYHRVLF